MSVLYRLLQVKESTPCKPVNVVATHDSAVGRNNV